MELMIVIACLGLGIIPARIAKEKGYSFGTWYVYGILLFPIAFIHSGFLKDRSEEIKKCEEMGKKRKEEIRNEKKSPKKLIKLIKLYDENIITKEEFKKQKDMIWGELYKTLDSTEELINIKNACDNGLLTGDEYNTIKEATINPASQTAIFIVEFDETYNMQPIEIKAHKEDTKEDIEEKVKELKYISKIKSIKLKEG